MAPTNRSSLSGAAAVAGARDEQRRAVSRAEQLGARLPPLVVAAERVAATILQGVHGRRRSGRGDAFWQFRNFDAGDAAARIDWRQSAKSDRLYVRETEWDAAQTVAVWRDASRSMEWRSRATVPSKRDRAELLALALAALLLRGGEWLRLLGAPGRAGFAGRTGLAGLAQALAAFPTTGGAPPADPEVPRHARAVLIGDFLNPLPKIQARIDQLASRPVRGHLLQVLDPAEETLPYAGRIRFEGMLAQTPTLIRRTERVREAYAESLARHRAGLAALAAAAGWSFATHRTDHPAEPALLALWRALAPD